MHADWSFASGMFHSLQIHDEMILEVRLNERDIKLLQDIAVKSCCNNCEQFFGLKVPLMLNW